MGWSSSPVLGREPGVLCATSLAGTPQGCRGRRPAWYTAGEVECRGATRPPHALHPLHIMPSLTHHQVAQLLIRCLYAFACHEVAELPLC